MSIARTVSSVALGALGALGNQTTNQPVVNNNITINSGESVKDSIFFEPKPYSEVDKMVVNPEFIDLFKKMCINLLTVNDYALLANIIDQSKRIIFSINDLQIIISKFLGCESVIIYVLPPVVSGGCLCKVKNIMYLDIEYIKNKSRDFKLMYNTAYNMLKDDYHVCLDKVLA